MTQRLRKARLEDAVCIAEIHVLAWQTAYESIISADYLQNLSISQKQEFWSKTLSSPNGNTYVSSFNNNTTGWISFGSSSSLLKN